MQITSTDRRIARQGIGTTVKSGPPSALGFDFRPTAINAALNTRGQTGTVDADRMSSLRTRARTVVSGQQRKPSESRNIFNDRKEVCFPKTVNQRGHKPDAPKTRKKGRVCEKHKPEH